MQDTELFLSLAEIAGVFVGFGALIAVRSGGTLGAGEVSSLRWVMSSAIWVVIAALTPILISRYGVTGHALWLACALPALVIFGIMIAVNGLTSENQVDVAATLASASWAEIAVVMGTTFWLPAVAIVLALAVTALGLFPDQEPAIYLTAVGLGLIVSALHLFVMVFWQPQSPEPRGR